MKIQDVILVLEQWAPLSYQESYDNAGLIVGDPSVYCSKILCSLDCTEDVIDEAIQVGANMIVAHHPIVFKGIKQFQMDSYVARTVIKAIQNNIAIYAIHTNLDNILEGVNKTLADTIHLENRSILSPQCSSDSSQPTIGAGIIGELPLETNELDFLKWIKDKFHLHTLKHTALINKPLKTIALCGGAGSFLISAAKQAKADCFITSDLKYHEFFDTDNQLLMIDIGHGESEQFVPALIVEHLTTKFPNFAVLESKVKTNPVFYF